MKQQKHDLCFHNSYRFGLRFITIILIGIGLILGQTEEPQKIESDYTVPEIVIIAAKSSQTLQQVPLSTTLVSRKLIDMVPASEAQ